MKSLLKTALTIVALCVFTSSAHAGTFSLSGPMDELQAGTNNGFGGSTGNASGTISGSYDDVTNLLDYTLTWQNLSAGATNIHFHNAGPGVSGGVALAVPSPHTSPLTSSSPLTTSQETDLLGGNWYVNVHSSAFPGGEIRGQVLVTAVPEPGTAALGLLALTGLVMRRRR